VKLTNVESIGIRPLFSNNIPRNLLEESFAVCPTVRSDYGQLKSREDYDCAVDDKTETDWGAITGLWEGYACDTTIRFKGSSGGALTAIALYCLEKLEFHGVLQAGQNSKNPIYNETSLSQSREDVLSLMGSRYSPTSVCDGLDKVESAPNQCVLIGRPVDVSAIRNVMEYRPSFAKNVGVILSFFCAETPPTMATRELLKEFKVQESSLGVWLAWLFYDR